MGKPPAPRLYVNNGYQVAIPGLGKIRSLWHLSEKRITAAVRDVLRRHYGTKKVKVACEARRFDRRRWIGTCWISERLWNYEIS